MKRFFAAVLALCLICGATALAAESIGREYDTEVHYTVEKCTEFTVYIPPEINLTPTSVDGVDYLDGTEDYSLDVSKINTPFGITIELTDAANGNDGFYLAKGDEKVPYAMDYCVTGDPDGFESVFVGTEILNWAFGRNGATSGTLLAFAQPEDFKRAGEYTDQLTFTVRGEEIFS